jgi:hypothetical protein
MLAQTWQGVKRYVMYRFNRLIRQQTLVGRGSRRAANDPVNRSSPFPKLPEPNP